MTIDYLLYESSVGYAVFKVALQADSVGSQLKEVQNSLNDLSLFGKMVDLVSFAPFKGAQQALENANDISEGIVSEYLQAVLEGALPKSGKNQRITLGVADRGLAGSIKSIFPQLECETSETSSQAQDLLRGLRQHGPKLLKQLQDGDTERAQLGLGHAYSRAKVKFSVQKDDNHVIQAIATLDHMTKAINTFSMRAKEWYSWHFPELTKIVTNSDQYPKVVLFVGDKSTLSEDKLHDLAALLDDDEMIARSIIEAARVSMGRDISAEDMENVLSFARRSARLIETKRGIEQYLTTKMDVVAPNLSALIGPTMGSRLISKAGSLTNLSKFAASTVQILGAEKALFRALKTKGNTPKYGLLYHSSFLNRAGPKNKGRMSRYLANKCSIASRIDNFSEHPTSKYGEALRSQVEERLQFFATGRSPAKNAVVMKQAMDAALAEIDMDGNSDEDDNTATLLPSSSTMVGPDGMDVESDSDAKDKKKRKKEKKEKKKEARKGEEANGVSEKKKKRHHDEASADPDKSSKKKKKSKS